MTAEERARRIFQKWCEADIPEEAIAFAVAELCAAEKQAACYGEERERLEWTEALAARGYHTPDGQGTRETVDNALEAATRPLVEALTETRDAAAVMLVILGEHGLVDCLPHQFDGFGVRANKALAAARKEKQLM